MSKSFIYTISWNETFIYLLWRVFAASLVLAVIFLFTEELGIAEYLSIPLVVVGFSIFALISAYLSQLGVPFAGLLSYAFSIPFYLGDPLVWLAKKIKPELIPVAELSMFNPAFVWVLKGDAEY